MFFRLWICVSPVSGNVAGLLCRVPLFPLQFCFEDSHLELEYVYHTTVVFSLKNSLLKFGYPYAVWNDLSAPDTSVLDAGLDELVLGRRVASEPFRGGVAE